jgi:HEAT repeat protein
MMPHNPGRILGGITLTVLAATIGCGGPTGTDEQLRDRASQYVRAAARFPDNPAVRAQAMEAIAEVLPDQAGMLLREGLKDEHVGVRFAACMSLGALADRDALAAIRPLAEDPDPSVRVAAYFAIEKLGETAYRRAWRDALLISPDAAVRRNAALAMGRLGNKNVLPLLARVSTKDDDEGVRLQALEAMALLGDAYATNRFIHDAYGGLGFKQPFALLTLGHVDTDQVRSALRARLANAPYLEARLAAARGLGMQRCDDGYDFALRSLNWNQPQQNVPDDPPALQVMRIRSMAAMALGQIGRRDALGPLQRTMENENDPRVQLASATAILMILNPAPATRPANASPTGAR